MSHHQHPSQPSTRNSSLRLWIAGGVLLIIAALVLWWPKQASRTASQNTAADTPTTAAGSRASSPASVTPTSQNATNAPAVKSAEPEGPTVTRSSLRETVVTASGVRKALVDPMASWTELPPWPEGPQLYADVETPSTRYVNLRPDDIGEMPRINAEAGEKLELKVSIPTADAGEKIHIELPNGGSFTDTQAIGRVLNLSENRTLTFDFIADDSRGYCTVKFRHRGHTRSLPVWVGAPEEKGS